MAKVSLNSHPEYVSQTLKRYRVAPAMAKPRPGAGKAAVCCVVAPGDWLSVIGGKFGRLGLVIKPNCHQRTACHESV